MRNLINLELKGRATAIPSGKKMVVVMLQVEKIRVSDVVQKSEA